MQVRMAIMKSPSRHLWSMAPAPFTMFHLCCMGIFYLVIFGVPAAASSSANEGDPLQINLNRRLIEAKVFMRHPLQNEEGKEIQPVGSMKANVAVIEGQKKGRNPIQPDGQEQQNDHNDDNREKRGDDQIHANEQKQDRERQEVSQRRIDDEHHHHEEPKNEPKDEQRHQQGPKENAQNQQNEEQSQEQQNLRKEPNHGGQQLRQGPNQEEEKQYQETQQEEKILEFQPTSTDDKKHEAQSDTDQSQQARMQDQQLDAKKDETFETDNSQNSKQEKEAQHEEPNSGVKAAELIEEQQEQDLQKEEDRKQESDTKQEDEEHFQFPEAYLLGPVIKDWDSQRAEWLRANPHMRVTAEGKPRVLMITGSNPTPCRSSAGDNFYVRAFKLKLDYARIHKYEIFYNLVLWDPLFSGFWVKLPTLRNMMLTHPEIEWFFWVDSDAVFTDILYEAPLDSFDGYNMVMEGWMGMMLEKKSWLAANDGVVLIRNCQWTLDLIDKWSPFGPDGPTRNIYGKMLTKFFTDRLDFPADDQAALSYLMITDESVRSKVKLLDHVHMSGYWKDVVKNYETLIAEYHPGLGDDRWPWVTHFTGCSLCNREADDPEMQKCLADFQKAYNFADNQVLAYWGFQHESLSEFNLTRTRNETDRPLDFLDVNPWAERIAKVAAATGAANA